MVLLYMVTWIPSIYPHYVSIYTSTMDPSWVCKLSNASPRGHPRLPPSSQCFQGLCAFSCAGRRGIHAHWCNGHRGHWWVVRNIRSKVWDVVRHTQTGRQHAMGNLKPWRRTASLTAPCLPCWIATKLSLLCKCCEEKDVIKSYTLAIISIPFRLIMSQCPINTNTLLGCYPGSVSLNADPKCLASFARIAFKWAGLPLPYGRRYSDPHDIPWPKHDIPIKRSWIYEGFLSHGGETHSWF